MLKITVHDSPDDRTFQLEGKLIGAWARELEQSWITASSIPGRKSFLVDLTGATFIDNEGKRVLSRLFREGGRFKASAPLTRCIIGEITGEPAQRSSASLLMSDLTSWQHGRASKRHVRGRETRGGAGKRVDK